MDKRKIYWLLVIVGGACAITGIVMMRSQDVSLHAPGKILGWVGIAIVLIARIFFARWRLTTTLPPKK